MNYFTQELEKICKKSEYINSPKYVGRACIFRLSDEITGKMEFVTRGHADHYSALKLSLFNRREGQIDSQFIGLTELLGMKTMRSGENVAPHIWGCGCDISWYGFTPCASDYSAMAQTADDYLSCFADLERTENEALEMNMS